MSDKINIAREDLVYQKEALRILGCDKSKLQKYVDEGKLKRIKSSQDKRFTYYLKDAVEQLVDTEEFYYE